MKQIEHFKLQLKRFGLCKPAVLIDFNNKVVNASVE